GRYPVRGLNAFLEDSRRLDSSRRRAARRTRKLIQASARLHPRPVPVQNKDKGENRLRKLWQQTRYPPLRTEFNHLQRDIKRDLLNIKRREWDDALVECNNSDNSLLKLIARVNKKPVTYSPLLGFQGLIYGTREKADLFVDTLEESFQENRTSYYDEHIDKVDRKVRRFLRSNIPATPPLTSPNEVCNIILKLGNKKAPGQDQIKNISLKSLPINAITRLTKITNKCLMLNHFPRPFSQCYPSTTRT
ncbi:RNA-directed DNA polymerase from mobile element jockey, partial [Trichonephila clavipes]